MTRVDRLVATLVFVCLLASGCGKKIDPFPDPGNVTEKVSIYRRSSLGPIVVIFTPYPIEPLSPPDGVREAAIRAVGGRSCSVAAFYWPERSLSERWIADQLELRIEMGTPLNIILAGHSLGATAAAETARFVMHNHPEAAISLLLTVDAIKTGKIGSTAGTAGAVIAGSIPGVKTNLTAYDSAPAPDGRKLLRHVNYFQQNSSLYHGVNMPDAENRPLHDSSGLLNHGNADDFAVPLMTQDFVHALNFPGVIGGIR